MKAKEGKACRRRRWRCDGREQESEERERIEKREEGGEREERKE